MDLHPGTASDYAMIRRLLQDAGLPVDDLDTAAIDFIVASEAAEPVGVVGVERFEHAGLLRSLAVRVDRRGRGIGERLVAAMETRAASLGIGQLVLLTETAAPFFAGRGYAVLARDQAPAAVRTSAEFRSLCPVSATCMTKSLELPP